VLLIDCWFLRIIYPYLPHIIKLHSFPLSLLLAKAKQHGGQSNFITRLAADTAFLSALVFTRDPQKRRAHSAILVLPATLPWNVAHSLLGVVVSWGRQLKK